MKYLLSFEKSDVEYWRVEIHKLEHKNLEGQVVFILSLRSMHF